MWSYHCAGEWNCVDESKDAQILLEVSTIHHIKEKNCKQNYFCKNVANTLEMELNFLKMMNAFHLYVSCTEV